MDQSPDTLLVDRLKEGDVTAFDALFLKYYKVLCANAFWFLQQEHEAKDLVQTFFMDIWDKKLYLQFNGDVKGYLHMAVKNRCLNHLKRQKIRDGHQEAFSSLQDESWRPEQEGSGGEYYRQLQSSLEQVTGQKRMAIHMVYMEGKRYQEAADEMGISVNSFKTHLKRGLKLLRLVIHQKKP
ncbi:RNA polymerase sigma factor [Chitinophaga caseinilytica]|uniref:RNA polymerase sigma factor n=1 Tax=Chitinophaga caseinilytica TaxID=2267521 RepID=UPI003C3031DD